VAASSSAAATSTATASSPAAAAAAAAAKAQQPAKESAPKHAAAAAAAAAAATTARWRLHPDELAVVLARKLFSHGHRLLVAAVAMVHDQGLDVTRKLHVPVVLHLLRTV
jgi:hypothetical protein